MVKYTNNRWVLSAYPEGPLDPSQNVSYLSNEILPLSSETDLDEGTVLVQVDLLGIDAFIRTMLTPPPDGEAFHGSVKIGDTIPALGLGTVILAHPSARSGTGGKLTPGTQVVGMLGAQSHAIVKGNALFRHLNVPGVPRSGHLGILGLSTGMTAWVGLNKVTTPPRKGETVVVSAAAGAVGSIVCCLAKARGARVVGIAGGEKKCNHLVDVMKCDAAVNYKAPDVGGQLDVACPNGINMFYDNVGGEILDLVLERLKGNCRARVVICGAISQYNTSAASSGRVSGPGAYLKLAERGASMHGFTVMQYMMNPFTAIYAMIILTWGFFRGWLKMPEHVERGIETFPKAMVKMFEGGHIGKLMVDVSGITDAESKKHE